MSTEVYKQKRNFSKTSEPKGAAALGIGAGGRARFVVQKHDARRLHYDLRLEADGVLLSWAVPKGPSLKPADKRLAVKVEDHPIEYATFEGTIPKGEYGAGTVMLWDSGYWVPGNDVEEGLRKGKLSFELHGKKLKGSWHLARMSRPADGEKENWLLMKSQDRYAVSDDGDAILNEEDASVLSNRSLSEIAKGKPPLDIASLPKVKKKEGLPSSLAPQLATLVDNPPEGEDWLHEIKFDGYRLLAFCDGNAIVLKTRNGHDWTSKFSTIEKSLRTCKLSGWILDGEVVALADNGISRFQDLQNALGSGESASLRYMVFDVPFAAGFDLADVPLLERKRVLKTALSQQSSDTLILYSDHVIGNGHVVFENACSISLEGIICKKTSSVYRSKRNRDWVKVKCDRRQEFLICGFTEPEGSREGFGALYLAYYDDREQLRYAGKVGTGFSQKMLARLRSQLGKLAVDECPLEHWPANAKDATWVNPILVAEIKYAEKTEDGLLRQAVFIGLRSDKPASAVKWESPIREFKSETEPQSSSSGKKRKARTSSRRKKQVTLTHPERVLFPSISATKRQVADYYYAIADAMLPFVARRPLSLLRHPKGLQEKGFFHKHIDDSFPRTVQHLEVDGKGTASIYGYVTDAEGLVGLLQMGTTEIHTWNARIDDVERPDLVVMDLDPDENLPSELVVGAAILLRDLLEETAGLKSFLKTTGGKGLHVVIPIRRGPSWTELKEFSKAIATALKQRNPDAFVLSSSKSRRAGKIYIDYLRNARGSTSIAPFSTRARPGAPVSVPVSWQEAGIDFRSDAFTIENVLQRLPQLKRDPWPGYFTTRQGITKRARSALRIK